MGLHGLNPIKSLVAPFLKKVYPLMSSTFGQLDLSLWGGGGGGMGSLPIVNFLITQTGDFLVTQDGDNLIWR
jgi:hypothetical protein